MTKKDNVTPIEEPKEDAIDLRTKPELWLVLDIMSSSRKHVAAFRNKPQAVAHAVRRVASTGRDVAVFERTEVYGIEPVQLDLDNMDEGETPPDAA